MYITTNSSGDILGVSMPVAGVSLPEGLQEDGETYCFQITEVLRPEVLLKTRYWDFSENALKQRPESPGVHYYWTSGAWQFSFDSLLVDIKEQRFIKLVESDWTQIPDSPLTTEQRAAWATYRQALRDLPANLTGKEVTVEDAPWPTPPTI